MYRNTNCKLQAHRGVSTDAPENTMAAFRLAVAQGYDIIEFDPKCTKDDVVIVLHDKTLNRTGRIAGVPFGEEKVKITDLTFAELSDIDVGEWFDKKYCGEHIPSLAQALDYMKSVDIEAKIDNVVQKFTQEQIEKVDSMLSLVDNAYAVMIDNLSREEFKAEHLQSAVECEIAINERRTALREEEILRVEEGGSNYQSSVYYIDTVVEIERMGDYIINISEALQ